MIYFALSKGRLAEQVIVILEKMGIVFPDYNIDSRKLLFESNDKKYCILFSKPSDVPTYVDYGVADIGIVGKDTLLEEDRDISEVLDLKYGQCRIVVAGFLKTLELLKSGHKIRVATKYPNIARKYFESHNQNVEIIKLNGSVELGPVIGLSDVIVDIVESGKTLKENGLEIFEVISESSARLVVNNASLKRKYENINDLIKKIKLIIEEKND